MLAYKEITAIMAKKFKDENCVFTEKDIKVRLINSHIEIQIRDYEHITFKLFPEKIESDFVIVTREYMPLQKFPDYNEFVGYHDSKIDYPFKEALIDLAYHISNTF